MSETCSQPYCRVHILPLALFLKGEKLCVQQGSPPLQSSWVRHVQRLVLKDLTTHHLKLACPGFGQTGWERKSHTWAFLTEVVCHAWLTSVSPRCLKYLRCLFCCHPAVPDRYLQHPYFRQWERWVYWLPSEKVFVPATGCLEVEVRER